MKRIILAAALVFAMILLPACGGAGGEGEGAEADGGKITVVTTIFPEYDWVRQIAGDRMEELEVTYLLGQGVDIHSYQPSVQDVTKIVDADVLIYVGGESDAWIEDLLKESGREEQIVLRLMDPVSAALVEEELIEGMEPEEEEEAEEEEGPEYDEHIWLSLRNAKTCCTAIRDALSEADPEGTDVYAANAETYIGQLDALDQEYSAAVADAPQRTMVFAGRFPYRYLTEDYGLEYYAAFPGCSAESEASFETITFLAGKVQELGLKYIVQTDNETDIATAILSAAADPALQTVEMNSMQSVSAADAEQMTYLGIMQTNLEAVRTALGS